ncbi:MAG: sigma-70 family RNA polymerase sigma factor [Mariniphaga sp.]
MTADKDIWNEFKNEEADALSFIYSQNIDFLFFYGKRFTSDEEFILDIIQDLFYDLIKYRKTVSQTDNIRLYLLKSFRRKLLRGIEIKQKLTKLDSDYNQEPEIVFSIEEEMINDEEQSIRTKFIRRGLQALNAKQREVIYYKFTLGYDYDQICEIMSINYDSARQLVSRGISSLKQFMSENKFILLLIYRRLITK